MLLHWTFKIKSRTENKKIIDKSSLSWPTTVNEKFVIKTKQKNKNDRYEWIVTTIFWNINEHIRSIS